MNIDAESSVSGGARCDDRSMVSAVPSVSTDGESGTFPFR